MTRPACSTSGNCTLPWPAARTTTRPAPFIANVDDPCEGKWLSRDRAERRRVHRLQQPQTSTRRRTQKTDGPYFLLGAGVSLVLSSGSGGSGSVFVRDAGIRRVLAVQAKLLVELGQRVAAAHQDLRFHRQQKGMSPKAPGNRSPARHRLPYGEVRRKCSPRWSRRASLRACPGPLPPAPVRRDNAELGILHHEAVLRAGLRYMVGERHDRLARSVPSGPTRNGLRFRARRSRAACCRTRRTTCCRPSVRSPC